MLGFKINNNNRFEFCWNYGNFKDGYIYFNGPSEKEEVNMYLKYLFTCL